MTLTQDYAAIAVELSDLLGLSVPPVAITFWQEDTNPVPRYVSKMPVQSEDGRTGAVPAGCVFWIKATDGAFSTEQADHANCSVGSFTHGFKTRDEIGGNSDVKALLEAGWVSGEAVGGITTVRNKPSRIIYGPLHQTIVEPDVVLLRLNAKQAMIVHDSVNNLQIEGKPQCHIIAIAKESGQTALSVGCMLSRVRTGMSNNEMTCAIPSQKLSSIIEQIRSGCTADMAVAAYAAADGGRFNTGT